MNFRALQEKHLKKVRHKLKLSSDEILKRAEEHDQDKFNNPEIYEAYNEHFADLKKIPFGTEEYKQYELKYFDKVHQIHAQNRHHYYSHRNTLERINLFDVLEAVIDISESAAQYGNGDYEHSLKDKLIYDYDLKELIDNTIEFLREKE